MDVITNLLLDLEIRIEYNQYQFFIKLWLDDFWISNFKGISISPGKNKKIVITVRILEEIT